MDNTADFKTESVSSTVHKIITLELINYKGNAISLKELYVEVSIHEGIFTPFCSGYIQLLESFNLFEDLPITGEETLKISYTGLHSDIIDREFAVYAIDTASSEVGSMAAHVLKFCSVEVIDNKRKRLSRAFTGLSPATVVTNIIRTDLNSKKDIEVEESPTTVNYISPYVTPFAVCATMASRSYSPLAGPGSLYVFYEDADGYKFKSVELLYTGEHFNYIISEQGLSDNVFNDDSIVIKHSFEAPVNTMANMQSGVLGNNIQMLDLDSKKLVSVGYDYYDDEQYKTVKKMDAGDPESRFVTSDSKLKTNECANSVRISNDVGRDVARGRRQNRIATLTSGPKVHIEVPINCALRAGSMIRLEMPSKNITDEKIKKNDEFVTGIYLASNIRQVFTQESGYSMLELVKDGYNIKRDDDDIIDDGEERLGL